MMHGLTLCLSICMHLAIHCRIGSFIPTLGTMSLELDACISSLPGFSVTMLYTYPLYYGVLTSLNHSSHEPCLPVPIYPSTRRPPSFLHYLLIFTMQMKDRESLLLIAAIIKKIATYCPWVHNSPRPRRPTVVNARTAPVYVILPSPLHPS